MPNSNAKTQASDEQGHDERGNSDLLVTINNIDGCLDTMNDIIQKSKFIAINASIEAARSQTQQENFSLVAEQVVRQAERTSELSSNLKHQVKDLEQAALQALGVNFTDVASDLIDKIDRNLFERNCDCQAWAGFRENIECAKATFNQDKDFIEQSRLELESTSKQSDIEAESVLNRIDQSCKRLHTLSQTYRVYLEVIVINNQGIIVSAANDHSLIGHDLSKSFDFKAVMSTNEVYVSDMYFDEMIGQNTVAYSAPIQNESGQAIGLLSTRFNWKMIQQMIDDLNLPEETKAYVISNSGEIISATKGFGILKDNLVWMAAGEHAVTQKAGFTTECFRNGRPGTFGFCHTFGYNAYQGKEWSAIVGRPVNLKQSQFLVSTIDRSTESRKLAAGDSNNLLSQVTEKIRNSVKGINTINSETNMLAVNAAIQAGVAGAEGEAFSVIASEIGQLARQSEEFVEQVNLYTKALSESVADTVLARLGEAAFDTIDKVERNLFERNCDVQAFASFAEIRDYQNVSKDEVCDVLRKLHDLYEVYQDIMLLDTDGNVVAAAMHRELIGQNQSDRDWFRNSLSGNLIVTDFYHSNSMGDYTVSFASPVLGPNNEVIGVLTTRFACDVMYDILRAAIVGPENKIFLINSRGIVIGSPDNSGVLKDSFAGFKAFRELSTKAHGFTIEQNPAQKAEKCAVGFSKGHGYLNYKGHGWSVLVVRDLNSENEDLQSQSDLKLVTP